MIQYDYSKLDGKIKEVYGSQKAICTELSITEAYFSRLLNNKAAFTQDLINKIVILLDIPSEEIGSYFFESKVR